MEDARPKGEEKDLISWTDEDLDAMDYKNRPDYDPDQDDTEYGTTSESEPESETLMSEQLKASREAIEFGQYTQLKVATGGEEVKNSGQFYAIELRLFRELSWRFSSRNIMYLSGSSPII